MNRYFNLANRYVTMRYSCEERPNPADFQMHTHEECELYYFDSGKGTFKIEGSQYPLRHGDIVIMSPAEAHYIDISPDLPYVRFSMHFNRELFSALDESGFLMIPFTNRKGGCFNLYRAEDFRNDSYKVLIENMLLPTENREIAVVSNLMPLLYEIAAAYENKSGETMNASLDYRIIRYINRNITNHITLDSICQNFYISKPQLCRIFKKATGSTVRDYITAKRLIYARSLIGEGVLPTTAYMKCGFNDYSVFYRAYRKRYGISPAETKNS